MGVQEDYNKKVLAYINNHPNGATVKLLQTEFQRKHMVSESLRYLAKKGYITCINFRFYPICSQVIA